MGFGLRSGPTAMPDKKIDWLMGLGSKLKCDVSAGKLNSGTSGNLLSILPTSFRISSQVSRIVDTDHCYFHSSLNHFQQTSKERKQFT